MIIESARLGTVEIDEASIIQFPDGLVGFEDRHRFALVPADDDGAYSWLHCVDDPALAFLTVVPHFFFDSYEVELGDDDVAALDLTDQADAQTICLVSMHDDGVTANLLGPVVLNVRTQVGRQVVLAEAGWSARTPLAQL